MNKFKKVVATTILGVTGVMGLAACTSDADKAAQNIATAAEQFEVQRTLVGINGITGDILFYAEGRCSFEQGSGRVDATCKYGENDYRKHVFIMGDQDSVTITQEEPIDASVYHTRVVLKPQNLLPAFDLEVG